MEGPTRPVGQPGESANSVEEAEADYIQRIMRSLTDSSTSSVPSQYSNEEESRIGSISSYSFDDSCGRIPDTSYPGLSPWSYFPVPSPGFRELAVDSSEPNWRSTIGSPQILSPVQREILADFPWLNEELDQRRLINTSTVTGAASSSQASFPRLSSSKEESDACTTSVITAQEPSIETPMDRIAWAQSMLELQSYENSTVPDELFATRDSPKAQARFLDQAQFRDRSTSVTPANSESDLSSSLSDGEAEPKKQSRLKDGGDAAGTSGQSGRRKRAAAEQEGGEDVRSDGGQQTKKPINRPRKKGVKRLREPRYAIKTRTDTEVMDDGYKWRKYGQKGVKNSPNPRNYYRCTTPSCPVRKRVERCFEDPGLVVTTYEGTHTHQSPSFLRIPPGYPGGSLQALLDTLSHHYKLAGNPPLPPFHPPRPISAGADFPLSTSDLYQSSPLHLSQLQSQGSIHENLNLLRSHEQLARLQQEAAWASSIKNEPGAFQFPSQARGSPSFSNVSSLSDLSYDSRMRHYDLLKNSPVSDQLGDRSQLNPLDYSSLIKGGEQFLSLQHQQQPPFGRRPEFIGAGRGDVKNLRTAPFSTRASSDQGGLLEDMFRPRA